jgi:MarR family transcriptional regulator, 2-MHQ and catechol-resistance regulon repressor
LAVADLSRAVTDFAKHYQLRDRNRACRFGLTVGECYALEAIAGSGGIAVTPLARALGVNKSTASRVADSLAGKGLVRHAPDPAHHRGKRVLPTPAGRRRLATIDAQIRAEHRLVFAGFSPQARQHCLAILTALSRAARGRSSLLR